MKLDLRNTLGHADRERIGRRGGKTGIGGQQHQGHAEHPVVAEPPGHHQEDRNQRDEFLPHTQGRTAQGQDDHEHHRQNRSGVAHFIQQTPNGGGDHSGPLEDSEHTANYKDKEDDIGRRFHAPGDRGQKSVKPDRSGLALDLFTEYHAFQGDMLVHAFVGARYEEGAFFPLDHPGLPVIRAGRDDIGEQAADQDHTGQQNKHVWDFEFRPFHATPIVWRESRSRPAGRPVIEAPEEYTVITQSGKRKIAGSSQAEKKGEIQRGLKYDPVSL